jgi:hypothetical protein
MFVSEEEPPVEPGMQDEDETGEEMLRKYLLSTSYIRLDKQQTALKRIIVFALGVECQPYVHRVSVKTLVRHQVLNRDILDTLVIIC